MRVQHVQRGRLLVAGLQHGQGLRPALPQAVASCASGRPAGEWPPATPGPAPASVSKAAAASPALRCKAASSIAGRGAAGAACQRLAQQLLGLAGIGQRGLLAQVVRQAAGEVALAARPRACARSRPPAPSRASVRRWTAAPAGPGPRRPCPPACAGPPRRGRAGRPSGSPAPAHAARARGRPGCRSPRDSRCSCTRTARSYSPRRRNRLPSAKCSSEVSGSLLHRLDEGVDGLVLLLVEQEVQALEVGLGRLPVLDAQLAQVQARGHPAQHEGDRQAPAAAQVRSKSIARRCSGRRRTVHGGGVGRCCAARRAPLRWRHQRGTMPSTPTRQPAGEGRQHHQHQRAAPVTCRRTSARWPRAGCSARRRTG